MVLAVATAGATYARVGPARVCQSRSRYHRLSLPVATCVLAGVIFVVSPPCRHYDLLRAWVYVWRHPQQMSGATRDAVLKGVVLEGMAEDEAWAAGGNGSWATANGALHSITFMNLSQFGGDRLVSFKAYFVEGQVHEIERLTDPRECKEQAPSTAAEHPFVGFWKHGCATTFGFGFEPGAAGKYGVRFCGPGGCGEISRCVDIPGRRFRVIDGDIVVDTGRSSEEPLKRCDR